MENRYCKLTITTVETGGNKKYIRSFFVRFYEFIINNVLFISFIII